MATGDLVTLSEAKAWLEITGTDQDTKITGLITVASAMIAEALGRKLPLDEAARVEFYDGHGGVSVALRSWPIVSMTSVVIDGVTIQAASGQGFGHYNDGEMMLHLRGAAFSRGRANVVISYVGGFDLAGPEMAVLKQAALMTIQALSEAQGLSQVLQSENVPGAYSYSVGPNGVGSLPSAVIAMIGHYRSYQ
jgi:hypothetical protein